MSTLPVRAVPRYGAAIFAATALTGFGLYQGEISVAVLKIHPPNIPELLVYEERN